ncbi:MAG: gamma-glutamyltransferase, partial [Pseudomonadota bacterium]
CARRGRAPRTARDPGPRPPRWRGRRESAGWSRRNPPRWRWARRPRARGGPASRRRDPAARRGPASVAAAGLGPGLFEAHARAGRMPVRELLAPAVAAAREGFAVRAFEARLGTIVAPILTASDSARALFCDAAGRPLAEGERFANPALADVLEVMGHEGPDLVSRGEVAAALAAACAGEGHLRRADLAAWRPVARTPIQVARGDTRLWLNPPPALGGALIAAALALLPRGADAAAAAQAFAVTALARAMSRIDEDAAAGRAWLSQAAVVERLAALTDRPAEVWLAAAADGARAGLAVRGTTHISAIDHRGNAAALTLSNGTGAGFVVPGTGIMPNNMLGEDDLVPPLPDGAPGRWVPGVRLASMMAPTLMAWPDGRVAALGSGGSNRIRTALARVAQRLVDDARAGAPPDLEAAVAAPRLHVEGVGETTALDYEREGLAEAEERALLDAWPGDCRVLGWDRPSMFFGGVHAVARDAAGNPVAAADARRAGHAMTGL